MVTVYDVPYISKAGLIVASATGIIIFTILFLKTDVLVGIYGSIASAIVAYYLTKYAEYPNRPTLTYLCEEDVEELRNNLLKIQEKNND